MTLDEVIERHTTAMGGPQAIQAVERVQIDFQVVEPTFEADGRYRAERQGRMRVDIFMQGVRVFSEGFDGIRGWQWPRAETHGTPISPAGAQALARGIENQLFGLHELQQRGHHLELGKLESIEGQDYWVVKLELADRQMLWRYLNARTWRLERSREHKALHPDIDPTPTVIETQFSDFREIGNGLQRPFHEVQVEVASGRQLQTTHTQQVWINSDFEPSLFECP